MNILHPFGPPAIATRPRLTRLPADACAEPALFHRRLRAAADPGAAFCLLESSDPAAATATRSIVAARCPLRLELRDGAAYFTPLDEGAAPLIAALRERLPGAEVVGRVLQATLTTENREPALDDAARMRLPCVLDAVRVTVGLVADEGEGAPLAPGLFGAFGYEIVDQFDDLTPRKPDPLDEPDAAFLLATDLVVYDHAASEVTVITRGLSGVGDDHAFELRHERYLALLRREPDRDAGAGAAELPEQGAPEAPEPVADTGREEFLAGVAAIKEHITAGDVFQAVLSRGFSMRSPVSSVAVYDELRRSNPSPYMFHIDLADGSLLGASPETFLKVEAGELEIRPIAGTVPRGADPEIDQRLALQLLLDPKEQAEHAMLLDLARNDVARVSEPGSMRVEQQFEVERYSHVQHLVSRVRGRLRAGLDALHAFRAVANMGTLTGAPKLRAMELIRELEPHARGFYGGAAGYLLQDGRFDSCIVIRSLRQKGDVYTTRAGAGIVHDSDPGREFAETEHKARACVEAVARATAALPAERVS